MAASRLDDASLVLLAFAYLTGALALVSGFAPLVASSALAFEWKLLAALAGTLAASVLFVTLKYVSEAMKSLASVARSAARVEERLDQALRTSRHEPHGSSQASARASVPHGGASA